MMQTALGRLIGIVVVGTLCKANNLADNENSNSRIPPSPDEGSPNDNLALGVPLNATKVMSDLEKETVKVHHSVKRNKEDDHEVFVASLQVYGGLCLAYIGIFSFLRRTWPLMYTFFSTEHAPEEHRAPVEPPNTLFGWVLPSLMYTEETERSVGLDQTMLLEFSELCLKICACVGVPLVLTCPLHRHFGGNEMDPLSRWGTGNILQGSEYAEYFYWAHAILVWFVVIVTQRLIFQSQRAFIYRRFAWLEDMPAPRSHAVLVKRIPRECRSDKRLLAKFVDLFSRERVKSAILVKHATELQKLFNECEEAKQKLDAAKYKKSVQDDSEEQDETETPGKPCSCCRSTNQEKEEAIKEELDDLETQCEQERQRVLRESRDYRSELNSTSGFVMFADRRDVQVALKLNVTEDKDEWIMEAPPDPSDVRYNDLAKNPAVLFFQGVVGYGLMAVLFLCNGLFVGFVNGLALWLKSQVNPPGGRFEAQLEAVAATLGLLILWSYLPTLIRMILERCFMITSNNNVQHRIQGWYFFFMLIFMILVTLFEESNLLDRGIEILQRPKRMCELLAEKLPHCTNFYMSYIVAQCSIHLLNLTRYINIIKYWLLRGVHDPLTARGLSEPEDQDYYGVGARSARWSIVMVMGLVFGQINPLIWTLVLAYFLICRLTYGHLLVFAETRKPDLGGIFWVSQLWHLQIGIVIYVVTMAGWLELEAKNTLVFRVAISSFVYMGWSMWRFRQLQWKELAYARVPKESEKPIVEKPGSYIQPELLPRHPVRNGLSFSRSLSAQDLLGIDWDDSEDSEEEEEEESVFALHWF